MGLAGSLLIEAGLDVGLIAANEAFPDRAYEPDGSLRPRNQPGALIEDPEAAAANGLRLARDGTTFTRDGKTIHCEVDTLCIHGDTPGAAERAKTLHDALAKGGFQLGGMGDVNS